MRNQKIRNTAFLTSLILSLLTLVIEQAAAQDSPQSLVTKHIACVIANAGRLDDGQMDPKKLAEQVQPICHNEHVAAEAAVGLAPEEAQALEFDHTLAAVQILRSREQAAGHLIKPQ